MIETRCLPSWAFNAVENSSRLTSFKPTRRRGGLEVVREGVDFMGFGLSHGNNVNFVFCFGMANRHDGDSEKSGGIETLFAVVIAGIFYRDRRAVEYLFGLCKIKAVFFQVGLALGFLPREVHGLNYTYDNAYCKVHEKSGKSLT